MVLVTAQAVALVLEQGAERTIRVERIRMEALDGCIC
jgi:hypothetical protein